MKIKFMPSTLKDLGINKDVYGKIYTFVDFGNVNYWYEKDERDGCNNVLPKNQKLVVDIRGLAYFSKLFSEHNRFYFGMDPEIKRSIRIISKSRKFFDKTVTKPIQRIKHYLNDSDIKTNTRAVSKDLKGNYVYIPKCNFDVEISVDTIRLLDKYDTFCIFSNDADFIYLLNYLKRKRKKIILIKAGYVQYPLVKQADLVVNAQDIKKDITFIKQKSRL